MTRVEIDHRYNAPARDVWGGCTDFGAVSEVCKPLLTFEGLPTGHLQSGQVIEVKVRLFGKLPAQPYRMELLEVDEEDMRFLSQEAGSGVRNWEHRLQVTSVGPDRAHLHETIDIDAGWKTPLVAAWARLLYRHRHKGRLRLLGLDTP